MNSPLKNKPLHLPGQSLDEELNNLIDEKIMTFITIIMVAIAFIIYEWVRFYWSIDPRPVTVTVACSVAIFFSLYRIKKDLKKVHNLKQGREGERIVGQMLEELRSSKCSIFHDIPAQGFNIDHVIVSSHGIFTIETKTWSKRSGKEVVRFNGDHLFVNSKKPTKDVVTQSLAGADWMRSVLKESTGKDFPVWPVLVFPGWFIEPESTKQAEKKGFWLLNPKALSSYINNQPELINNEDLNLVRFHLSRYIQTTP
ncbi:MAG: nuclease-related domain-containing protein [Patescibacteria group bacterium UBA2163]